MESSGEEVKGGRKGLQSGSKDESWKQDTSVRLPWKNTKNIKENRSSYNLFKTCLLGSDALKIISSIVQTPHNVCHICICELVVL